MSTYSYFLETGAGLCAPVLPDVDVESIVDDDEIEKAYEDSALEAAMRVCAENTRNWNAIMEACTITEYCYLEQTGKEFIYEGAKLDSFIETAKTFFHKVWTKIQEIFKKVVAQFDVWFKSDKEFVSKYKKLLQSSANRGFGDKEMEVYDYKMIKDVESWTTSINNATGLTSYEGLSKKLAVDASFIGPRTALTKEEVEKAKEKLKDLTPEVLEESHDQDRAIILKGIGVTDSSVTSNEFEKVAKEALEGDKDSKKLGDILSPAIKFLENSEKIKTALNKGLRESKKSIDDSIRALEKIKKDLDKQLKGENSLENEMAGVSHSFVTKLIDYDKETKNILTKYNGFCLDSMKKASRQCKSVCLKALTYSGKKGEDRPSVLQQESAMSLLDNLRLV